MYIRDYNYLTPTVFGSDHNEIEGITRTDYATAQFIERLPVITLDRPTAVIYAGGATLGQSEGRNTEGINSLYVGTVPLNKSKLLIKELSAYSMHSWIKSMVNNHFVKYATINGNTCASSMHALYEANLLLTSKAVEEVIIIAEERTSFNTIRIFKEHRIDVTCADGVAVMRLLDVGIGSNIVDCKWAYEWNNNPFGTTTTGYLAVDDEGCSVVKVHGTGTQNNDAAERVVEYGKDVINYKKTIGHMQGASALVEICMLLDDENVSSDEPILCVASGMGGFYGSCVLYKQ